MMFNDSFTSTLDAKQSRHLADQLERQALILRQRADMLDPPIETRMAIRARIERVRRAARLISGYIVSGLTVEAAVDRVAGRFGMPGFQLRQLWKQYEGLRGGVSRRRGERMSRMRRNGWTIKAIATHFRLSQSAVRGQLAAALARSEERNEVRALRVPAASANFGVGALNA